MRAQTNLRTELILVFVLLAVVPLTGIVLYTYASSIKAFRNAVGADADRLADEMSDRLSEVKQDLTRGVELLGTLPSERFAGIPEGLEGGDGEGVAEWREMLHQFAGDVAPLIEELEFAPKGVEPPLLTFGDGPIPGVPAPQAAPTDFDALAAAMAAGAARRFIISMTEDEASAERSDADRAAGAEATAESESESEPLSTSEKFALGFRIADAVFREIEKQRSGNLAEKLPPPAPPPSFLEDVEGREEATLRMKEFRTLVVEDGATIGQISARIRPARLIGSVLSRTPRDRGEIPFAVDAVGELHFLTPADRRSLAGSPVAKLAVRGSLAKDNSSGASDDQWVLATRPDPETGLTFGIARPVGQELVEMRRTSVQNFAVGLGLIVLALLGILPLSARITRNLDELSEGADRLAAGDLAVRVPVRSGNELGRLAKSFNRMARDLSSHQDRLLAEERRRKEEDVQRRLLAAEDARKSRELEEARQFQLSLLPKTLPRLPAFDVAVFTRTATEVGGDYYDFLVKDGVLTIAIGDATGHGAAAGTMVTVVKSLFTALPATEDLPRFLAEASRTVRSMRLGRMAMALSVLRLEGDQVTLAAAGMPPMLIHRGATGRIDEVAIEALPLGTMQGLSYRQEQTRFHSGDTMLLMTDGFPELPSPDGDILGYEGACALFEAALGETADDLIRGLADASRQWAGQGPPNDDLTFVAVRKR